ncbi:MAG TPA: ATP-binding protein [Leucothrix sp.]|nr:ATP-binding protein [Leucothrix sp.]
MLTSSINSQLSDVRKLTDQLKCFCQEQNIDDVLSNQLELMLVEAVNNIIEHGYTNNSGSIEITFEISNGVITITLVDQGMPFPLDIEDASSTMPFTEDLPEGGWGLALIDTLADEVERYNSCNGHNILVITKNKH